MADGTRVLYVMYGMPSCYNNGFAFARRFIEDGFDITVACDQEISALAQSAEVPYRHLKSLSRTQTNQRYRAITQSRKPGRLGKLLSAYSIVRACLELRQQTVEDSEYLQLVEELEPDLLLIDIECHLAIIASSTLTIPTAICTRLFNHRPGGGVAPLHSNLLPAKQSGKKLRIAFQWWMLRVQSGAIALRQRFSKVCIMPIHYRSYTMPDIKAIARQYRVDLSSIASTAHWFRPVAYTHAPILSMTLGEIDFDRKPDQGFRYLGPMIGDRDYAFDLQPQSVRELDDFIDLAKQHKQPVIYCAMGTYAQSEPRFLAIMRSLAQLRKNYAFIISLGGREPIKNHQKIQDNALLLHAAPQIKCLSACNAAILHGGIASLQEALKHRVPVLCFSVGTNDQNGTTARWVNRKLATRFSRKDATANSLCTELDRVLEDSDLANRLEQYGQLVDKSLTDFSPKKIVRELCIQ